jgi:hypothetical protein
MAAVNLGVSVDGPRGHPGRAVKALGVASMIGAATCLAMMLPYLPGRFDASAAALSFAAQVAVCVSLLIVPIGLGWAIQPRSSTIWRRAALAVAVIVALAIAGAAASMNQLVLGVVLGSGVIAGSWTAFRQARPDADAERRRHMPIPFLLLGLPLVLVTFRLAAVPPAADWSRDRAIRHSAALMAEIESFRQRRGHYPASLHSLNPDVPTGVVGIERFHYEPSGGAYNLFFVRPHVELDAWEVVLFNPRDEHRFTSHELDILQHDGEQLDQRRGDRRRTPLAHAHWVSILFD